MTTPISPAEALGVYDLFGGVPMTDLNPGPAFSVTGKTGFGTLRNIKGTLYSTLAGTTPSAQLEATADGTHWFLVGSAIAGAGSVLTAVDVNAIAIRANLTAGSGSRSAIMILVTETMLKRLS